MAQKVTARSNAIVTDFVFRDVFLAESLLITADHPF
jgi:hypothetical protein